MCAYKQDEKPSLVLALLKNKCPRCRRGDLYKYKGSFRIKGLMKMNDKCPVCGQPLDMEPGFYYGTIMISYGLAVLISVLTFVFWYLVVGMSLHDSRFFWWIGANALFLAIMQPPLMRLSRTVWLAFFVKYSPNWYKGDIVQQYNYNKDQMGNW
jgi:uncharacterized protein (DUF983 family)